MKIIEQVRMEVVDKGQGAPIVLIPSILGRWEHLRPAVEALARSQRVITFSLSEERRPGPGTAHDLDPLVEQVEQALDDRGLASAVICGVSFGGRVALHVAARRPNRTDALVLVSTPGPGWHLKPWHRRVANLPWPVFVRRPVSLSGIAARALQLDRMDIVADCAAVSAPTLIVTGEPGRDHVVPADGSNGFVQLIASAQLVVLERTGHLGCITHPDAFADVVGAFLTSQR